MLSQSNWFALARPNQVAFKTIHNSGKPMDEHRADPLQEFRRAWQSGDTPPRISDFFAADYETVASSTSDSRASILIELIATDVEFRKSSLSGSIGVDIGCSFDFEDVPSVVAHYTQQFPELSTQELQAELTQRIGEHFSDEAFETQYEELESNVDESKRSPQKRIDDFTESSFRERYRRLSEHARGGMGVVWRVEDQKLGREIALKELPAVPAPSDRTRQRFVAEARVTAQLEHPGVVPVYDLTHLEDGQPSYTMKLLRGETLAVAIERFHSLDLRAADRALARKKIVDAFLSVCQTIAYAHNHRVLHRDLKPDNIHLGEYGETAVLDWGLAKSLTERGPASEESSADGSVSHRNGSPEKLPQLKSDPNLATRQGELLGTPAFMAPEQAMGKAVTEATDRYGLGAVLYQILTGRPPHAAESLGALLKKITTERVAAPRSLVADTPKPLEAICLKLLSKNPGDRYKNTTDIVADLNRYAADEAVSCVPESMKERLFRWMRKHQSLVVTGVAALILVAVSVVASLLVAGANQAREFAQTQRMQQIQAAAELANAVSTARMQSDDFSEAVRVIEQGLASIGESEGLEDLTDSLTRKLARAKNLAEFYQLLQRQYHYATNRETHAEYKAIKRCLELVGIDATSSESWADSLPNADLTDLQQQRLRQQTHSLILRMAAIQAFAGFGEFTRLNANSNIFNVTTTEDIRSKFIVAERYLDLAETYQSTTTARYLRTIIELGEGELTLPEWLVALYSVERGTPSGAVDCLFTATVLTLVAQFSKTTNATAKVAQFAAASDWSDTEAEAEAEKLLRKAVRLDPDYYPAVYQLAMLESQSGNFRAGLARFDAVIKLDPEGPEAYSGRAATFYAQKVVTDEPERKAEAEKLFQADLASALELGAEFGNIHSEVGLLQCVNGEMEAGVSNMLDGLDLSTMRVTRDFHNKQQEFSTLEQTIKVAANPEKTPIWMKLLRGTFLIDVQQSRVALPLLIDFPIEHAGYHRALAARVLAACALVRGSDPNWEKVHTSFTEEKLLKWSKEVTDNNANYYRGWHARLVLLEKLERFEQLLAEVGQALGQTNLKDWQRFELLWCKADCLENLDRVEEANEIRVEARNLSEIYYEHFASRTGIESGA